MTEYDKRWLINNLEVIVNHYKELEDEIREVRQEYEGILRQLVYEEAILRDAVKEESK